MTWYDTLTDPDAPTRDRVLAGVGCGLLPWWCVAQEAGEAAADAGGAMRERVTEEAGGVMHELRETGRAASEAATRPIEATSDLLKWGSIGLGVLLLFTLLGLAFWYVLLPFARGGPRARAA